MKAHCSIVRILQSLDWRKVALCLLSVAALNLQAGDVTVGVWIPMVPLNEPLSWMVHATVSWTSGDGSKTNVAADLTKRLDILKWHKVFQLPYETKNFVIIFTPEYGYELDRPGSILINNGEPVKDHVYLTDEQVPRPVVAGYYIDCSAAHASAAWTRGDGSVTNAIHKSGRFLVAKGETNIKIIYTPRWGYKLDKTVYEIAGPVNENIEIPKEDLPKATKLEGVQPMTDVVQWGSWSMANKDWVAPHGRFIDTPGQAMIDTYTEHLAVNPGDVEATVRRAFARLKTLGENEGFVKLCEMYGFTFCSEDLHFSGNLTNSTDIMDTTETIRTVCDEGEPLSEAFPIAGIGALKALEGVVADLDRVPKNWDGELVISPEEYPVDDVVLFDYGDVQALKSAALEASSLLNVMKGYNMTLDKSMLRETFGALERSRSSEEFGYNGPKRFFDINKDFMPNPWGAGSVRDARALALAQDQMHRALVAAREFDDWQLNHREQSQWIRDRHWDDQDKYGSTTCHFVELDMSRWKMILEVFRRDADKIVNLPYFTYEIDGYEWSRMTFRPRPMRGMLRSKLKNYKFDITFRSLFEGRLNRDHFPLFGGTTIATIGGGCHVAGHEFQLKDTPDPTLAGTFPGMTRRKLGAFLDQFCTVQKWDADDREIREYLVKYEFNCKTDIVNTVRNPATIAGDNPTRFYLLDPHVDGLEVDHWAAGTLANRDGLEDGEIRRSPSPNHKPTSPDNDDAYFILDNNLTYRPAWDPSAKFPTNRVGVCDWTWNADPVKAMDKIARGGRASVVQVSLSPWAWQGATDESWNLVRQTLSMFAPDPNPIRPSIGIRATCTTIDFPGEDYSSLHSISNTQGCLYGVLNGDVWQHDRWATNFLHVVKAAIMTQELGARRMSAKIGFIAIDPDLMYERVKAICDECMRHGIDFLIEAGSQPSSDVLNLLSRLRGEGRVKNVALSFNPCEAVLYGAEDPTEAFRLLKDEIRQIRLRDCKSDRANWNDDCVWGEGDFSARSDFDGRTFLEAVRALGFTGDIFYERRSGSAEPTAAEEEEIRLVMGSIYSELGIDPYPWRISFGEHPRMNVAWTSGNGSVTNTVGGVYFEVKNGTTNVKVIFTPKPGWELLDEGVFDLGTVEADVVFGDGGDYPVPRVRWSSPISYIDEDGNEQTRAVGKFEVVSSDTRFLTNGWYAVVDDVDIREATNIIVTGEVNLILCDWASLAVTNALIRHAGVSVGANASLTIYGQTNGTGRLTAKGGSHAAGIGASSSADGCGTVSIHGGTVTANGGTNASGIGGCYKSSDGSVTITGGRIAAHAKSFSAADLGNGALPGEPPCAVMISGGVFANRPENVWCRDGFGPVANTNLETATNYPYAIGSALRVTFGAHPNVTAAWTCGDGSVTNTLKSTETYFTIPVPGTNDVKVIFTAANGCTLDGDAVANVGTVVDDVTFGVRNDFAVPRSVIRYRDWDAENGVATNAMIAYENVTVVAAKKPTEFADGGWYAVVNNVTRTNATDSISVSGSAHLILCDGATLAITNKADVAAVSVAGGSALTIYGQAADSGRLEVNCGRRGAGIGGGNNGECGEITIHGGTIDAVGGASCAGIGCGTLGKGGTVTITGGRITATGHNGADDIGMLHNVTLTPCEVAIRGGIFAHALKGEWMAPGYEAVVNTDETTKVEYPWAVADNRIGISPGNPQRCDTADEATNLLARAIFAPSEEVIAKLGADPSVLKAYSEKFRLGVVPQSDGTWTVEALLKPEPWTNVVESAQEMTRQIPLEEIRELQLGMPVTLTYWLGVPGFYYSFYSGNMVTNVRAIVSKDGRNVLCGTDEEVTFFDVVKPSDEAGFFSVGVKETGDVQPSDRAIVVPGPVRIRPVDD